MLLLDGYEAQGEVWSNPDTRKATARYLCICPTTHLLYQGAGKAGTTRPEEPFAGEATNLCLERKVAGLIPERTVRFSRLQSHGNDCTMQCAYSEACCVQIV